MGWIHTEDDGEERALVGLVDQNHHKMRLVVAGQIYRMKLY